MACLMHGRQMHRYLCLMGLAIAGDMGQAGARPTFLPGRRWELRKMKGYFLQAVVFGVICSVFGASANAAFIRIEPSSQSIGLSDTTTVDVVAVLEPGEALGGFGMTVTIQDSVGLTSDVVDPISATVGAGFTLTTPISISLNSFADFVDVFANATSAALTGNVILTTITFDAMSLGTSNVGLGTHLLYDAAGAPMNPGPPQGGTITVTQDGGTVPAPATLALISLGFAGMGFARTRKQA